MNLPPKVEIISGLIDDKLPVRFQVSLFNYRCSGDFLFEIMRSFFWLGFRDFEIQVADTLQRHNFRWRKNLSERMALERSMQAGRQWFKDNDKTIEYFSANLWRLSMSRWDFWIKADLFLATEKRLNELYDVDEGFRNAIDTEVESYFERSQRSKSPDREQMSRRFLIEEIAVSELCANYYPANDVYPGRRLLGETYISKNEELSKEFLLAKVPFIEVDVML